MLIEQLIFTVISFALFVFMFYKMIKNNDTTYVIFLALEAIGIAIGFIEVLCSVHLNILFKIIMYVFAIILPVAVILLEKYKYNVPEYINIFKAMFYFNIGNNKKAKEVLINLLEKNSESYKGHKLLAQIYESEGGMRKAIDEYVQAIDINKQDYDSYFKVATLLNELDKKDEAIQMLYSLLGKKNDYKDATVLLGDLLIEQEMYKEAVSVYNDALKINPFDFDLNYNLGIVYTMMNDFQSAKQYYEKAAEINSLIYNCKYSLAEIALIYKELEKAEKMFMETLDDEELAPDSYYELSKICLIRGDKERAIQYANTALDLSPKKISTKIKKEAIFIPIIAKLSIPFNIEDMEDAISKLSPKELKAKLHLEEMFEITRQIGYSDIKMINRGANSNTELNKEQEIEIDENEKEDMIKERQD